LEDTYFNWIINVFLTGLKHGLFYVNNYLKSNVEQKSKTNGAINVAVGVNGNAISNEMAHDKSD